MHTDGLRGGRARRAGAGASVWLAFAFALVGYSGAARAQYANASVGLEAGALGAQGMSLSAGPAFGVHSTVYVGSGFELVFRGRTSLHSDRAGGGTAAVVQPGAGLRLLLSEELLRPYAGLEIASMILVGASVPSPLFAATGFAGLEYFAAANTSVGLQLEYVRALTRDGATFGAVGRVSWGF